MFASAGFSFILYLLVFFKLRGNITLDGYKVQFQKRPKVKFGRTAAGTYIMTDDRRVESHLTTVAKQMLWYPIAYTVLVLPIAAARFPTFTGASVPFGVTIFAASVFMLTGFVNAVLFCLTRNVLPGTWRQRFGIGSTIHNGGAHNATYRGPPPTRAGTTGTVSSGASHLVLTVDVEKAVEITYDDADSRPSFSKTGLPPSPPSPPSPSRVYNGDSQQTSNYSHPPPRDRGSIRIEGDGQESRMYRSAPGLEPPVSSYPFAMATPGNTDTREARPTSILIIGNPIHPPRVESLDPEGRSRGMYPTRGHSHNQ